MLFIIYYCTKNKKTKQKLKFFSENKFSNKFFAEIFKNL